MCHSVVLRTVLGFVLLTFVILYIYTQVKNCFHSSGCDAPPHSTHHQSIIYELVAMSLKLSPVL